MKLAHQLIEKLLVEIPETEWSSSITFDISHDPHIYKQRKYGWFVYVRHNGKKYMADISISIDDISKADIFFFYQEAEQYFKKRMRNY